MSKLPTRRAEPTRPIKRGTRGVAMPKEQTKTYKAYPRTRPDPTNLGVVIEDNLPISYSEGQELQDYKWKSFLVAPPKETPRCPKKRSKTVALKEPTKPTEMKRSKRKLKVDEGRRDHSFQQWLKTCQEPGERARVLIEDLNLRVDTGDRGLLYPLRRLVITGKDIQPNMRALFGMAFNDPTDRLSGLWKEIRADVYSNAERSKTFEQNMWDIEWNGWNPRPMSKNEEAHIAGVNDREAQRTTRSKL